MQYESFDEFSVTYSIVIVKAVDIILSYKIEDLASIILFGSCARLNIHSGSDVDLLILTKSRINDYLIRNDIKSEMDFLSNKISIDILFTTVELFNHNDLRIYNIIKKEGIYLLKEGMFTDVYEQLLYNSKKRLPVFTGY